MRDRLRGTLIGLAVGDALGAAVEFMPRGTFPPVTGYRGGGPHGIYPGDWTDDTSMALALADSIATAGWDLNDQARRYLAWWERGAYSVNGTCFDIGNTVRRGLSNFRGGADASVSGIRSQQDSGNGSIMRLAPVPIRFAHWYPDRLEELALKAEESSLPTHASPACRSACRYMAVVLAALIRGEDRATVLDPAWPALRRLEAAAPLDPLVAEIAAGSFRTRNPPEIRGSGWVVRCLEAALWAFRGASSFEEAVFAAVDLGDDADTTGAVCGQFAGAFWGESAIPAALRNGLGRRDMLEKGLAGLLVPGENLPWPDPPT